MFIYLCSTGSVRTPVQHPPPTHRAECVNNVLPKLPFWHLNFAFQCLMLVFYLPSYVLKICVSIDIHAINMNIEPKVTVYLINQMYVSEIGFFIFNEHELHAHSTIFAIDLSIALFPCIFMYLNLYLRGFCIRHDFCIRHFFTHFIRSHILDHNIITFFNTHKILCNHFENTLKNK